MAIQIKTDIPTSDLQLIEATRQAGVQNRDMPLDERYELRRQVITGTLDSQYGIRSHDVWTTNRVLHVRRGDLVIDIFDDNHRLGADMRDEKHGGPFSWTDAYSEITRDQYRKDVLHKLHDFQRKHNFRKAIFYGNYVDSTKNIITLADLPINEVLALQGMKTYFTFKGLLDPEKLHDFFVQSRQAESDYYRRMELIGQEILGKKR